MSGYQTFRGNSENKLLYTINNLIGGINTEFSDDTSSDVDFQSLVNFDMNRLGSLNKRKGFGELSAISQIFNLLNENELPVLRNKTSEFPNPELFNDNLVYAKLLRNDNNCFRNLSAFSGEKAYEQYQGMYGFQNNQFTLLLLTVKDEVSTAWLYKCSLPELGENGESTISITCTKTTLDVKLTWDRNLVNIDTLEFYDKIYFTSNDTGLICFNRTTEEFTYSGTPEEVNNSAYRPTALEISKVGFNVLGSNPLTYINLQNLSTDSIQGIYLTSTEQIPVLKIPTGPKFLLNIFYTGSDSGFTVTLSEGGNILSHTMTERTDISGNGLKCYEVTFTSNPTNEVEIKIEKTGSNIEAFYDYYEIEPIDPEATVVERLNVGDCGIIEMYNRAVYYKKDTIWFSDINNFSYVPNYNYITLPIEPTDEITKICYFKGIYVVFTKQRIYKLVGSFGSSDFAREPINMSLGCHAGNTVVPIENMLYFASPRGLYALKSSEFREGYENLVELDVKVKKLTSDYTLYNDDLSNPAIRFNGISEKAVATRYRDKYLLFYNSSYESGDYAAKNNLDVLAYQYEMKNFTTYSFVEKPTFLFKVDDAIETFCTSLNKTLEFEETDLVDYDFTNVTSNVVTDTSGNNHNGIINGLVKTNSGVGISFSGNDGCYINQISSNIEQYNELNINMDIDIKELKSNSYIFQFGDQTFDVNDNPIGIAKELSLKIIEGGLCEFSIAGEDKIGDNSYLVLPTKTYTFPVKLGRQQLSIKISDNLINVTINGSVVLTSLFEDVIKYVQPFRYEKTIGSDLWGLNCGKFDLYYFSCDNFTLTFKEGSGNYLYSKGYTSGANSYGIAFEILGDASWINRTGINFYGEQGYLTIPKISKDKKFSDGFIIEFSGKFNRVYDTYTVFDLSKSNMSGANNCNIKLEISNNTMIFTSIGENLDQMKITENSIDLTIDHNFIIECVDTGIGYTLSLTCDGIKLKEQSFKYGSVADVDRAINLIGKDSINDIYADVNLTYFNIISKESMSSNYIYKLYEFDTTFSDFDKPINVELISKGINLQYPLHLKKLKNIFVKVRGGYKYNEFFFELYGDGYLVNDPKKYYCYLDENGQVIYDYIENKELKIDEKVSLLGTMRLSHTRLGEGTYQTKKLIVPTKAKNFTVKIYGESSDDIGIDSFGYIFKLGKVKEN